MTNQLLEFAEQLSDVREHLAATPRSIREGKLKRVSGIVLEGGLAIEYWLKRDDCLAVWGPQF